MHTTPLMGQHAIMAVLHSLAQQNDMAAARRKQQ
jgi:hypothetical protein